MGNVNVACPTEKNAVVWVMTGSHVLTGEDVVWVVSGPPAILASIFVADADQARPQPVAFFQQGLPVYFGNPQFFAWSTFHHYSEEYRLYEPFVKPLGPTRGASGVIELFVVVVLEPKGGRKPSVVRLPPQAELERPAEDAVPMWYR